MHIKRAVKWSVGIALVMLTLYLFHQPLLLASCRLLLSRAERSFGDADISYQSLQWEEDRMVLNHWHFKANSGEVHVDRIAVHLAIDWNHLSLCPQIEITHPHLTIFSTGDGSVGPLPFFYRSSWVKPRWVVNNGVLQFPSSRFYFSLVPQEEQWGRLLLSADPDMGLNPLVKVDIFEQDEDIRVEFEGYEADLGRSLPLLQALLLNAPFEDLALAGEAKCEGEFVLSAEQEITEFVLKADVEGLNFSMQSQDLHIQEGKATLEMLLTQEAIAFSSQTSGTFSQQGHQLAFAVQGQGSIGHSGQIEMQAECGIDKAVVGLELVRSPKKKMRLHVHAQELSPKEISLTLLQIGSSLQCVEGRVDLEANLLFSSDRLDQLEIVQAIGEGVRLYDPNEGRVFFAKGLGVNGTLYPYQFNVHVDEGEYTDATVQLTQQVLDARGIAMKDRMQWELTGSNLVASHPQMVLTLPTARMTVEKKGERFKVTLPIEGAMLQSRVLPVIMDHIAGQLTWTHQELTLSHLQASCHGVSIAGNVSVDSLFSPVLELTTSSIHGSLADVSALAHRAGFIRRELPAIDAQVCSGAKGFVLQVPLTDPGKASWQLKAMISHLHFPVNDKTRFEQGKIELSASSSTGVVRIEKGEGQWRLADGSHLSCALSPMTISLEEETKTEFCAKLSSSRKEVGRVEGGIQGQWDLGWIVTFNPQTTHFSDVRLTPEPVHFSTQLECQEIELRPLFSLEGLPTVMEWCQKMGILSSAVNVHAVDRLALKGQVQARVVMGSQVKVAALSSDLQIQGTSYSPMRLEMRAVSDQWVVDTLQVGLLSLKTTLVPYVDGWRLPYFEGGLKGIAFKGSGYFKSTEEKWYGSLESVTADLSEFSLQGSVVASAKLVVDCSESATDLLTAQAQLYARVDAPIACAVRHDKPLLISYSALNGLKLAEVRLVCLEPGWEGREFFLEQIQYFYDTKGGHLRLKTYLEEEPLWASLQLKAGQGVLHLLDHPKAPGLKVSFGSHIESIDGKFYGLECHMHHNRRQKIQKGYALFGSVAVDMQQLQRIFSQNARKSLLVANLGSGYSWTGDLVLFEDRSKSPSFKGTLHGKEFEALGYRFEEMKAAVSGNVDKIQFSACHVQEGEASIDIPSCTLTKNQGEYLFEVPTLQLERVKPSALRKIGEQTSPLKPFKIEKFLLTNLSGTLGKVQTFQAEGSLTFVNQFKKETSLLDLPLELVRKMGLDLKSLTPVKGALEMQLRGDKFYLLSLQNAFSEADRAQFYLLPSKEPSYIDLNGNVHIDLKMHQETVLKMIEPFTLTMRGTLDKPRYGLKF